MCRSSPQCSDGGGVARQGYLKSQVGKAVAIRVGLGAALAAMVVPAALYTAAGMIDNPWSVTIARADKAGALLARLLLQRQHGHRPVILVSERLRDRNSYAPADWLLSLTRWAGRPARG